MKIPEQFQTNSVTHKFGGNGWAVVAANKGEWFDVVQTGPIKPSSQIFHVWTKAITIDRPIEPTHLEKIDELRAKLASGDYVVKNTRIVKAQP